MPTYRFKCKVHGEFEQWHSIHDDVPTTTCVVCGKVASKVFSPPQIDKSSLK